MMSEVPRLRQLLFWRFGDVPIGDFIVEIVVIIFVFIRFFALWTFVAIDDGEGYSHYESREVSFPRDMVFDGIFRIDAPDETSVKEYHQKRDYNEASVTPEKAAEHQEKRQSVDEGAGSDVDASSGSAPCEQASGKHQQKPDFCGDRFIKII